MRILPAAAILLTVAGSGYAQADQKIDRMIVDAVETFTTDRLPWADEPILPKGAKSALLVGDPSKAGVFIAYLKFPPNYKIPSHTHPFAEVVTVLTGKLGNGMGEKFDARKGGVLNAGASFALPAGHAHFVWTTDEETIVELIATGPWGIAYADPKEDPRKETK
ncbi:MAG: cupin domain-containing protein [Alphaproteobacteria bacterium]|nr:cupin domain-containing protein [Alphaproteobacteria bacterium]MBM3653393.1 cupin domain-containing protein [Alphaproteobacteria bacterium]